MGVILLVRHGQASVDAVDYDVLSALGERQAELVGSELQRRGADPAVVVSGALRRQVDTAERAAKVAGWHLQPSVDLGWNEFDHTDVIRAAGSPAQPGTPLRAELNLDVAIPRWSSGEHDQEYIESFASFVNRVEGASRVLAARAGKGETAVVFTSAGVIACVAMLALSGGEAEWRELNRVVVNASITKVIVGRRGMTLSTFNEHSHLGDRERTYA